MIRTFALFDFQIIFEEKRFKILILIVMKVRDGYF
jgi:hypothetical protein